MDGKKRRKGKKKHSTSTSTRGDTAPAGDSRQPGCDHDLHKGEDVSRPTQAKTVALEAQRKERSSKDAPGENARIHQTASTGKSLVGVDKPQPINSVVSQATSPGGGGGDGGEGKKSKKSRKRRRQEAALSLATTTGAEAKEPSVVSAKTLHGGGGGSSRSSSSSTTKKGKKSKGHKKADNTTTSSSSDSKRNTVKDAGGKPQQSGASSTSRGSSGDGAGGGAGGSGARARAGAGAKKGTGAAGPGGSRLSDLQKRMRQKLEGAQFRMINETLYTSESGASLAKFKEEPDLFDVYHRGFREQVEKWPVHPLDVIIEWIRKHPKARIADFGCGEARLAATVPNKVFSFDLVSPNPLVTACDMAHVPLKDGSVHLAIFCLSLMGTNLADFLREAHRVLVTGGLIKVAEVRSRFEGEEGGVERFLEVTQRLGFDCRQMDRSNKMFLMAEFKKSNRTPEKGVDFEAKACIYKRR
ncbi:unnamed protein product [Laminaria digitata]